MGLNIVRDDYQNLWLDTIPTNDDTRKNMWNLQSFPRESQTVQCYFIKGER